MGSEREQRGLDVGARLRAVLVRVGDGRVLLGFDQDPLVVAVVDDGLDVTHEDLAANADAAGSINFYECGDRQDLNTCAAAPLLAVDFEVTGTGRDQAIRFYTKTEDEVVADAIARIRGALRCSE